MKIEIYTRETPPCPFCINTKKWLKSKELAYTEYDVNQGDIRFELDQRLGHPARTVPQIFVDGELIGGYTDLISSDFAKSLINQDLNGLSL